MTWACMEGDVATIEYLLHKGSNIHSVTRGNGTPLHHAASYGHPEACRSEPASF
jgi:ankyrin repeat protein